MEEVEVKVEEVEEVEVEVEVEKLSCSICGEEDTDEVFHALKCGHTFHYKCLHSSFKNMKNNICPYCRSTKNVLPIISGLKKIHPLIHYEKVNYNMGPHNYYHNAHPVKTCPHVLTRGKNKGTQCSKNCKLGYGFCSLHYKNHIKDGEQIVV